MATRTLLISLFAFAAAPAGAQQAGRPYLGLTVGTHVQRSDEVDGSSAAAGVVAGIPLSARWTLEVDAGRPATTFARDRSGKSQSFAPAGSTFEEFERLAVTERFYYQRQITSSISVGAVFQQPLHRRLTLRLFLGVTNHHARERLRTSIVAMPEGVDPERLSRLGSTDQVYSRNIGGPTLGAGVSIALTRHLAIAPDIRYDYGSIGDEINNAWRTSLRTIWTFQGAQP
jgi:hypothetical protein